MPPAQRTSTSPAVPDTTSRQESTRVGFREAMRVAYEHAARAYLIALLREVQGEVARAARLAGVKRESLHRLLRKHGVSAADFRPGADEGG